MLATRPKQPLWRTLLVLGRVSNLPTVWSNCYCGWLLSGGESWTRLGLVSAGATSLYLGGMFLNDAFDAPFDQQRRRDRPIPSGAISVAAVWKWGLLWMFLGCVLLAMLGWLPTILTAVLATLIVAYNAVHKIFALAPAMMASCRLVLLLLGAAAAGNLTGLAAWSALALGAYTFGLTALARGESSRAPAPYWPAVFLLVPVLLAFLVNPGSGFNRACVLAALLVVWLWRCLRLAYRRTQPSVLRSVAGLLAGIVLVDLLAVGPAQGVPVLPFLGLFGLALLLQRFVPAT